MLACPECRKLHPSDALVCSVHRCALVPAESLPAEEDVALEPGTMLGEYRIDRRLGAGTFGAVYAGEQPVIGKKVAVKLLHEKFASNASVVSRFVSEARAVNRIRHKNIIDIFSFGVRSDGQPYFVMELLDGVTLRELLDRQKRLDVKEALPILRGIADALDAAHEAGVTHRDLKPDNVFLAIEKGGRYFPKVLDFGIAKLAADDVGHKTATGAAIGTPSYMSPEQCRGKAVDHRADVYALGVVIHEMLTGHRLFQSDSATDLLVMHIHDTPSPMSEVCPEVPKDLDAPVLAMLAKRPSQRPSSASEAIAAIAAIAEAAAVRDGDRAAEAAGEACVMERADATRADAAPATDADGSSRGPGDTSVPVVIPVGDDASSLPVPATTADGRFAISSKGSTIKVWDMRTGQAVHTFQGQAIPAPGEPTPAGPVLVASDGASTLRSPASSGAKRRGRSRSWALIAGAAAIVAGFAVLQRGRSASPVSATSAPSGHVTVHLAVTPADADVVLDGRRIGTASEPLVLPRSDAPRSLRVEKPGFEPYTLWILPDRDFTAAPVDLRPASAQPAGSAAPAPTARPGPSP